MVLKFGVQMVGLIDSDLGFDRFLFWGLFLIDSVVIVVLLGRYGYGGNTDSSERPITRWECS